MDFPTPAPYIGAMHEVRPTDLPDAVRAMFEADLPIRVRLDATLDGFSEGWALVDDIHEPSWGAVTTSAYQTYLGGSLSADGRAAIIEHLALLRPVEVVAWADDAEAIAELPEPTRRGEALNFDQRPTDDARVPALIAATPSDTEVRRIDAELFERCVWHDEMSSILGPSSDFLSRGVGLALMRGDEVLCETYAAWRSSRTWEIGVITPERYRRHGYAAITCAHLVRECERAGFQTYWNCAKDNLGSAATARRLGYERERELVELRYAQRPL